MSVSVPTYGVLRLVASRRALLLAAGVCGALALQCVTQGAAGETSSSSPKPIEIATPSHPAPVSFEAEILPILRKNCLACHKSTGDPEAGLVLETPAMILKGGDSGPAVVPNKSGESRLLQIAAHQHDPFMPPVDNKVLAAALTSDQLGLIKLWIDQGAHADTAARAAAIVRQPLPAAIQPIFGLAISPDDELVACSRGEKLLVYDTRGPRLAAELVDPALATSGQPNRAHEDLIRNLAFSHQGDKLASAGFRCVKIWTRPKISLERETAATAAGRCLAVDSAGHWFAIGGADGAVQLHDLSGKEAMKVVAKHDGVISGLAFSPDSTRLYSASADRTLRATNLKDGAALGKITLPAEPRALCLVQSGQQLATGDADNVIRIWSVDALVKIPAATDPITPTRELKGHNKPVTGLAPVPTAADQLLSGSEDGHVRLWNTTNGNSQRDFEFGAPINGIAIRPDGQRIAAVGANGAIRIWKPDDGALVTDIKTDSRSAIAVTQADATLNYARACVEYRKEELRDAEEQLKKEKTALDEANKSKVAADKAVAEKTEAAKKAVDAREHAQSLAADAATARKTASDKKAAAQSAADQAAKSLSDATTAAEAAKQAAAKEKDNAALSAASQAADKAVTDARTAKQSADAALNQAIAMLREAEQKDDAAKRAASNAADQAREPERNLQEAKNMLQGAVNFIVTATEVAKRAEAAVPVAMAAVTAAEKTVTDREAQKKQLADDATAGQKPLLAVSFSADNKLLAMAGEPGSPRFYDAQTGSPVAQIDGNHGAIAALAFASNGRLISHSSDGHTAVWSTAGAWPLTRTIGHIDDPAELVDRVLSIDFSPDGKLLATGSGVPSRSGQLKIWDVATGQLVREIEGAHRDTIFCVRFSPDGQYLATGAADRLMKVFRVADGSLVRAFEGHSHHVLGVSWSADGHRLASAGGDRVVKLWNFDTGVPIRTMRGDSYQIGEYKREVTSVSFVGGTEHLVTASGDNTVRLHRMSSERDVRIYKDAGSFVHAAVATSDGRIVIAGDQTGTLHFWNGENPGEHQWFTAAQPEQKLGPK